MTHSLNGEHQGHERYSPPRRADRLPPQNIECEQGVLGSVMQDAPQMHTVAPILAPDDFFRASHQVIYRAIKDLYLAGRGFDLTLVIEELERRGKFDEVGRDDGMSELFNAGQCYWNAGEYAEIVRAKSMLRKGIDAANEFLESAYRNEKPYDEIFSDHDKRFYAIRAAAVRSNEKTAGEVTQAALDYIERRRNGEVMGVMTNFRALDAATDGLQNGEMIVLAARPSQGKSALAMNICEQVAVEGGVFTLFISLEMKQLPLGLRLLSSRGSVSANKFKRPHTLTPDDCVQMVDAQRKIASGRLIIDDTPGKTVSQIASRARALKMSDNLGFLVIDYLGKVNGEPSRGETRQSEVARISEGLFNIAKELNIPVLVLHQLNRASENREDRRPRLSDLRDSGAIEQDADIVILLHNPSFYNKDDRPGEVDVLIAKNRNGMTKAIRLAFIKNQTKFGNLATSNQTDEYDDDWE